MSTNIGMLGGNCSSFGRLVANAVPVPTITLTAGAGVVGTAIALGGTVFNDSLTALDYSADGVTWLPAAALSVTGNAYSATGPTPLNAGTLSLLVRDHNATAVASTAKNFTISAVQVSNSVTFTDNGITYTDNGTTYTSG